MKDDGSIVHRLNFDGPRFTKINFMDLNDIRNKFIDLKIQNKVYTDKFVDLYVTEDPT